MRLAGTLTGRRLGCRAWLFAMLSATAAPVCATDLVDAWRAAELHDLDYAAARSAREAGATRRDQASSLWRPRLVASGAAGLGRGDTTVGGARFSAPGIGTSTGVAFDTSVNHGLLSRWGVQASMPLYNRERDAQARQLDLSADAADLEWEDARQTLILVTTQRYLDVVLAQESLRVLRRQQLAVGQALNEARDRFRLGDVPVTDTHEAQARFEAIAAQVLALETDLQLKQTVFSDATGLQPEVVPLWPPAADAPITDGGSLAEWLAEAEGGNPRLRVYVAAVEVARQESAKTRGALSPSIDLVAQLGHERLSGRGDFGSASNSAGSGLIGVQLLVPLYTGGMRDARNRETQFAIDKAQAQLERTRQTVAQQVRIAWLGLTVGSARSRALAQALASTRSRLDATRLGRKVGDRTTLDLLNAENDAAAAELALLSARAELLMNRLRLAAAAGRLDEGWLKSTNASLLAPAGT